MRVGLLAAVLALAALVPAPASAATHDGAAMQQVRFGSSRGFGRSPGFGRSRSRPFNQRRRGTGIFRRIIRALAIGYLLHLLFTTPGGLIVLVFLIGLVMLAMRRLRTRRYSY